MITAEEMVEQYAKGYSDKTRIYFIEHVLYTFNAAKGRKTPFMLFPRQKAFLHSLAENKASIAIKPRQAGITTVSAAWISGQIAYADEDSPETILCIGNKLDLANQMVTKIREFLLQVPRWYWGDEFYSPDPKAEANKRSIFIKDSKSELELFNGCHVYARSSGENAARGISAVSILIFDEAAFIENAMSVYSSAVAATSSVPNAKIIMVSTPNGRDPLYYTTYRQALAKENNYNAVEFRWYQDPRYNKFLEWHRKNPETGDDEVIKEPTLNNEGEIRYDEDHWNSMLRKGYVPTSPWYKTMVQQFNNDPVKIAQELDVSFVGSSDNVVAPEYIEMHERINVREPLEEMKDALVEETWFWKPPIEGHKYLCGVDVSRGSSEDYSAIEIIDLNGQDDNGMPIIEQVCEYYGRCLGDELGELIYNYATMYNNAFVAIDCTNGIGDVPQFTLIHKGYKNLYYDDPQLKKYTATFSQTSFDGTHDGVMPGFHMQGNRYPVFGGFANAVRNNEIKIRSTRVINELNTWIFKGDAKRIDHSDGAHDDAICALGMALFIMKYSYNKLEAQKSKDKAILNSYMVGSGYGTINRTRYQNGKPIVPENKMPFVKQKSDYNGPNSSYMWLFAGYGTR